MTLEEQFVSKVSIVKHFGAYEGPGMEKWLRMFFFLGAASSLASMDNLVAARDSGDITHEQCLDASQSIIDEITNEHAKALGAVH